MARSPAVQEIEPFPEADRLEGFPHPRETRFLHGQEAAEQALADALASGRIHHGWLFAGPEGIGKATLAYRFAAYALARPEERGGTEGPLSLTEKSPALRLIRAMSHPGLLIIRRPYSMKDKRFAANIPVDEVRKLRGFLAHTAGGNASAGAAVQRVVIVDQADELNISSANALLKSLEEPPPQTLFLLITSQPGRLLPTIRSRCRTLTLPELSADSMRAAAVQALTAADLEPPEGADWQQLTHMARGSVRRLLGLLSGDGLKLSERVYALMEALPKVDWNAVHTLGDELGSTAAEQKFEAFFDLLLDLTAALARAAATGEGTPREIALAQRLVGNGGVAAWAELWQTIGRRKAEVQALNLDRKGLILEVIGLLRAVAQK